MALLVAFAMLVLAMTGRASCTWCVCKDLPEATLQKTLDYACGAGADCGPIHSNGPCFQPNNVRAHCSYAVNSFFQKKGQTQGSCDFAGTAAASTSDPSYSSCSYPATASAAGTSISTTPTPGTTNPSTHTPSTTTPSTNTPSTTTPSNTTPTTTSPYSTTPSNGVLGGIGTGVSPTGAGGAGINTDITDAGFRVTITTSFCIFVSLFIAMVLWG